MNQKIADWFENRKPYGEGLDLLIQTGASGAVIAKLSRHQYLDYIPALYQDQLEVALNEAVMNGKAREINTARPTQKPIEEPDPPAFAPRPVHPSISIPKKTGKEPAAISALYEKGKWLMKQYSAAHVEMGLSKDKEHRAVLAQKIMEQFIPEIDRVYDQIRQFDETGKLPAPAPTVEHRAYLQGVSDMKEIIAIRTRISQRKTSSKKARSLAVKKRLEKEMIELQEQIAFLEQKKDG